MEKSWQQGVVHGGSWTWYGSCTTNDELIVMQMSLARNQQPATRTKCESPTPDFDSDPGAVHQVVINL